MHCTECNENKEQRQRFEKSKRCGCCNGARNISFHRYVQYQLGWVTWLYDGGDAPVHIMEERCKAIIEECYSKYNKKGRPILKPYEGDYNSSPSSVMYHYARQFKAHDTILF